MNEYLMNDYDLYNSTRDKYTCVLAQKWREKILEISGVDQMWKEAAKANKLNKSQQAWHEFADMEPEEEEKIDPEEAVGLMTPAKGVKVKQPTLPELNKIDLAEWEFVQEH